MDNRGGTVTGGAVTSGGSNKGVADRETPLTTMIETEQTDVEAIALVDRVPAVGHRWHVKAAAQREVEAGRGAGRVQRHEGGVGPRRLEVAHLSVGAGGKGPGVGGEAKHERGSVGD